MLQANLFDKLKNYLLPASKIIFILLTYLLRDFIISMLLATNYFKLLFNLFIRVYANMLDIDTNTYIKQCVIQWDLNTNIITGTYHATCNKIESEIQKIKTKILILSSCSTIYGSCNASDFFIYLAVSIKFVKISKPSGSRFNGSHPFISSRVYLSRVFFIHHQSNIVYSLHESLHSYSY